MYFTSDIERLPKKRFFILLRFTLIIAASFLFLAETGLASPPIGVSLVIVAAFASNVILALLPSRFFDFTMLTGSIIVADTMWITMAGVVFRVEIPDVRYAEIRSLWRYHQANIRALRGEFGIDFHAHEIEDGTFVGRRARLPSQAIDSGPVLVGCGSRVHRTARLGPDVVLGCDTLIDRHAILRRTIVLPGTYVGEGVELENAIVWGRRLIRVDRRVSLEVPDEALLADLLGSPIARGLESLMSRLAGGTA